MSASVDAREEAALAAWDNYQVARRAFQASEQTEEPQPVQFAKAMASVDAWKRFSEAYRRLDAPAPEALVAERNSLVVDGVLIWCTVLLTGILVPVALETPMWWISVVCLGGISVILAASFLRGLLAHYRRRLGQIGRTPGRDRS